MAPLLRQAVNNGYEEGFVAAVTKKASVRPSQPTGWQYYFRQAFDRGYEDGYYSRNQYGRYSNGPASILGTILETILNLQQIN